VNTPFNNDPDGGDVNGHGAWRCMERWRNPGYRTTFGYRQYRPSATLIRSDASSRRRAAQPKGFASMDTLHDYVVISGDPNLLALRLPLGAAADTASDGRSSDGR
jgi:hypothetical protein